MKKFLIWVGVLLGMAVAAFVLWKDWTRHLESATERVMKDLPKEVGVATKDYQSRLGIAMRSVQDAKKAEVIDRFTKAFGG